MKYPENIRDVAALQPDYMGFIFYKVSKRFINDSQSEEFYNCISELSSVNRELKKVGVFVDEPIKNVISLATQNEMDMLQLHGNESPEYCENLRLLDFKIIKAFGIDAGFDFSILSEYSDYCDYFLFDVKSEKFGGTGQKFDWNLLKQYNNLKPIFLSGGLEAGDIPTIYDLLKDINIHALDFNSKLELEPALKDVEKCREVIHLTHSVFSSREN
ncbi:MAG: phosphoribosylanthranilate isomerase [Bacteroidota bacterium]|nr:phosphoribosylanthranilate isomerase [Bacteroidota bacterium]